MRQRLRRPLAYGLIAVLGAVFAYYALFSQFAYYDDEGYVLVSLSQFLHGGTLYDEVYSQYGPLYHELFGAFFGVTGIDLVNDNSRLVVLVVWVLSALGLGLTAEWFTARLSLGAITMLAALGLLIGLAAEPMHPIGLATALIIAVLAAAVWAGRCSVAQGAVVLGLTCGALAMVKVNLGGLAVVGVVVAALLVFGSATRWARWAALALLVVVPAVLLASNLNLDWVQDLMMLEVGALLAIAARAWPANETGSSDFLQWAWRFAAAFVAISVVSLLVILALGSSPSGVFHALVLDPPKLTSVLLISPKLPPESVAWAIAAIAVAFAFRRLQGVVDGKQLLLARAIGRMLVALAIWLSILAASPFALGPPSGRLAPAMVLAWIAAVAPRELEEGQLQRFSRLAIALVAVLEVLQAYPVAVSQLLAATVPFALLAAIVMGDGLRLLSLWNEARKPADRKALATATTAVLVAAGALVLLNGVLRPLKTARAAYRSGVPLELHGAERIHLPKQQAAALRTMTAALRGCDPIVGYPGVNSFYIWAGKRPPTGQNATNWYKLFNGSAREQEIVDAIKDKPGLCVIRNDQAINFVLELSPNKGFPHGPLATYLQTTPLQERLRVDTGTVAPALVLYSRPAPR